MLVASLFALARRFGLSSRFLFSTCLCCWLIKLGWLLLDEPSVMEDFNRRRARWEEGEGGAWREGMLSGGASLGMVSLVGEDMLGGGSPLLPVKNGG